MTITAMTMIKRKGKAKTRKKMERSLIDERKGDIPKRNQGEIDLGFNVRNCKKANERFLRICPIQLN